MKISVQLVTYNNAKYLPWLFKSLRAQTFLEWEFLILDNNSSDQTPELLERELNDFPVPFQLIKNKENKGFAGGHSQAFGKSKSPLVLLINPDLYLEPACLEKLVNFLDAHPAIAGVAPRLMKWNFSHVAENLEQSFTSIIDSLGLKILRNRRVIENGAGEEWKDSLAYVPVFGLSGTCALFRRQNLEQAMLPENKIFDESYHSYKEDVDLAYRLVTSGSEVVVAPSAVAYHDRAAYGASTLSDVAALKNKRAQSSYIQYHSYKNHLATLYKNELWPNLLLDFPWILWYEIKKFGYFLLFDRAVLKAWRELWQYRTRYHKYRSFIQKNIRVEWKTIRQWWQ